MMLTPNDKRVRKLYTPFFSIVYDFLCRSVGMCHCDTRHQTPDSVPWFDACSVLFNGTLIASQLIYCADKPLRLARLNIRYLYKQTAEQLMNKRRTTLHSFAEYYDHLIKYIIDEIARDFDTLRSVYDKWNKS